MNYALVLNDQHKLIANSLGLIIVSRITDLPSHVSCIYVFEDTNFSRLRELKSIGISEIILIQEGFFPYSNLPFTWKQFVRYGSSKLNGPKGTRQMMYSADKLILFNGQVVPIYLRRKIISHIPVTCLKNYNLNESPFEAIYFANDFLRIGCKSLHKLQLQRYLDLKVDHPHLKFRPHPAEREYFLRAGLLPLECMDKESLAVPSVSIGNISTALLQCLLHGSSIYIDDLNSRFVQRSVQQNIIPIIEAAGLKFYSVNQLAGRIIGRKG